MSADDQEKLKKGTEPKAPIAIAGKRRVDSLEPLFSEFTVVPFTQGHLEEMATLYAQFFYESAYTDTPQKLARAVERATITLQQVVQEFPEYCLSAVDERNTLLGSIFGEVKENYRGPILMIDSVMVVPQYRSRGVGKTLLSRVFESARANHMVGVKLMADLRNEFPRNWYERTGFHPTGWAEYYGSMEDIDVSFPR